MYMSDVPHLLLAVSYSMVVVACYTRDTCAGSAILAKLARYLPSLPLCRQRAIELIALQQRDVALTERKRDRREAAAQKEVNRA